MLIESKEAASRLARVIVSDIQLYHREKIDVGADMTAELAEGYRHFRARVVPALLPLFEMVLADKGLVGGRIPADLSWAAEYRHAAGEVTSQDTPVIEVVAPPAPAPAFVPVFTTEPAPVEPFALAPPVEAAPVEAAPIEAAPVEPPPIDVAPIAVAPVEPPPAVESPPVAAAPAVREGRDPEAVARRLARVIVSDIEIYNPDRNPNSVRLKADLVEGRALFRARAGAAFAHLFEEALVARGLAPRPPAPAAAPAAAEHPDWLSAGAESAEQTTVDQPIAKLAQAVWAAQAELPAPASAASDLIPRPARAADVVLPPPTAESGLFTLPPLADPPAAHEPIFTPPPALEPPPGDPKKLDKAAARPRGLPPPVPADARPVTPTQKPIDPAALFALPAPRGGMPRVVPSDPAMSAEIPGLEVTFTPRPVRPETPEIMTSATELPQMSAAPIADLYPAFSGGHDDPASSEAAPTPPLEVRAPVAAPAFAAPLPATATAAKSNRRAQQIRFALAAAALGASAALGYWLLF